MRIRKVAPEGMFCEGEIFTVKTSVGHPTEFWTVISVRPYSKKQTKEEILFHVRNYRQTDHL